MSLQYNKSITLTLPKPPSLNMIYAGKHWTYRKKKKDEYKQICLEALDNYDKITCKAFRLDIRYNARFDIDNGILVSKFLADTLVDWGMVKDDSPEFYDQVKITFDPKVKRDTYKVKIKYYE
jgi:hypothetical protein